MKILVFGATGTVGARVARRLLASGLRPSVFVRNAQRAKALLGDLVDLHVGDLSKPGRSLATAMVGVEEIFLVTEGAELAERDRVVVSAALSAGVRHVVKLSTLDVRTGIGTGPWHARGEDVVRASGLTYTFLQAAGFMSNALGWADSIRRDRVLRSSTGDGRIAFLHPEDLAAVAVAALTRREHDGEALVITGREALSYKEMADAIGRAIGEPVAVEALSDSEAYARTAAWAGKGAYTEALVDIWRAVREGRLDTVTDGVERVLGRRPISFDTWATENAAAFR